MAKKAFKTESKKLLDMMINSIYTHKEIFLRELISNASDAIDKMYFKSLTDDSVTLKKDDYEIRLTLDKDNRIITIADNGIGMNKEDLEKDLGTIAKSGSSDFKNDPEKTDENIDIIGQFGVGFYSAFMVADKITVESRAYNEDTAYIWESSGVDGYTIEECEKSDAGTKITLHIKEDSEEEKYSEFLEEYKIKSLVKKYSDYIRYPIRMQCSHQQLKEGSKDEYETIIEDETLNSMVPLWKRDQKDVTDEEYKNFYSEKFYDYEAPLKVIRQKTEGQATYTALLFIPARAPFDYYTREYEKGLELYSSSVMIMQKCKDLLPDYYSFVKGLVDSSDLSLNISRETLQHDRQVKIIAKAIEKKINSELKKMLKSDRENYEKFYDAFGNQLKVGVYQSYGQNKDLIDLIMFKSSLDNKLATLSEYVSRMREDQKKIYFATGETAEKIALLPQVESIIEKGYEVLYLTNEVDEFAIQMVRAYEEKEFCNVLKETEDLLSDDEKKAIEKENKSNKKLLELMKEAIGDDVTKVQFTSSLKNHPVCLSSEGELSIGMEQTLKNMPGSDMMGPVKAQAVLDINVNHKIADTLKNLYKEDKDKLKKYAVILYNQARLISGLSVNNPSELSDMVCDLMTEN